MVTETNVINVNPSAEPDAPADASTAAVPPPPASGQPTGQQRSWSMPKSPVSRTQVDAFAHTAAAAARATAGAVAKAVAGIARFIARGLTQVARAIDAVPAALQLLAVLAAAVLFGIVGAITAAGTLGLICTVVVVPVGSIALGALGHRWFTRGAAAPVPADSDLSRSVGYVDRKLTLALNSLGSERHQQAVIALFQAKTAVELALGTEQDDSERDDSAPVHVDAYRLRPRIQAGSAAAS